MTAKLKSFNRLELASIVFYIVSGVVFLVYLPLSGFAPELALLGILSLIAVYGLFMKIGWTQYLLVIILAGGVTFSGYTLIFVGFSSPLLGAGLVGYLILVILVTLYLLLKKKE